MMEQAIRSLEEKISNLKWHKEKIEEIESDAEELLETYAENLATPTDDETYEITLLKVEERAKYLYDDFVYDMFNKHDYFDDEVYSDYKHEFKQDLKEKWEDVVYLAKEKIEHKIWYEHKLSEIKNTYEGVKEIESIGGNDEDLILTWCTGAKTLHMNLEKVYIPSSIEPLVEILDSEKEDRTVGLYGSYFHVEWRNEEYNNKQGVEMLYHIIIHNYLETIKREREQDKLSDVEIENILFGVD